MFAESSASGFARANLLCAIWALRGNAKIKGENGLAGRLVPMDAGDRPNMIKKVGEWLTRLRSDRNSKLIASLSDYLAREVVFQVVYESIEMADPQAVVLHVREGLMRGCALDKEGLFFLLECSSRCQSGNCETGLAPKDVHRLASLATTLIKPDKFVVSEGTGGLVGRDTTFTPHQYMVRKGADNCGIKGALDGDTKGMLEAIAISSVASSLLGGSLGWEHGTSKELVEELFHGKWSRDKEEESIFHRQPNHITGISSLKEELGSALSGEGRRLVLAKIDENGDEDEFKGACEKVLDGLVVAYYLPMTIVQMFVDAYNGRVSWKDAFRSLIKSVFSWVDNWAMDSSRLSDEHAIAPSDEVPPIVFDRDDLVDKVLGAVKGRRGVVFGPGVRVALVGKRGYGRRTVALKAAERLIEEHLVDRVYEIAYRDTPFDTLSLLRFEDDEGFSESSVRVRANGEKLHKLPAGTVVLLTGVDTAIDPKYGSTWDTLINVGSADLIVTTSIESRSGFPKFSWLGVCPLSDDVLVHLYREAGGREENETALREMLPINGFSADSVISRARIDGASTCGSGNRSPYDPSSLRGEDKSLSSELTAILMASLLSKSASDELFGVVIEGEGARWLRSTGCLESDSTLADEGLRELYLAYCSDGLGDAEWERVLDSMTGRLNAYLGEKVERVSGSEARAADRSAFHDDCTCAVMTLRTLLRISKERNDEGYEASRVKLLESIARWQGIMSRTRDEFETRSELVGLLEHEEGEGALERLLEEKLRCAALMGRLGGYEEAIASCGEIITRALSCEGEGAISVSRMIELGRGLPQQLLRILVRALRVRGYIRHDLWEESRGGETVLQGGMLVDADDLDLAIRDKEVAYELSKALGEEPETARILTTLAYSKFYRGERAEAERLNDLAIKLFRDLSATGERNEWLELAGALNSQGFFLSSAESQRGHDRERLKKALELKMEALDIRERYLAENHMDLARSLNNVSITLRGLGRISEAKRFVERAAAIRSKRSAPGESGHTYIDWNRDRIDDMLRRRESIDELICACLRGHQGTCSIFASDVSGENVIALRYSQSGSTALMVDKVEEEDSNEDVFESGSTIKVFIDAVLQSLIARGEVDLETTIEFKEEDRVGGSGILKVADSGGFYRLSDVAAWMVAVSDNIATNMIIRQLGVEKINAEIRSMGFRWTKVLHKLDFPERHDFGETTAKEYGSLLLRLRDGTLLDEGAGRAVLDHLDKQQNSKILAGGIEPYLINTCDRESNLVHVLSKSGVMNDVRADGGIVSAPWGEYVAVLMAKDFPEVMEYECHPSVQALRRVSSFLFDYYATRFLSEER